MLWEFAHSQTLGLAWVPTKCEVEKNLEIACILPYLFCNMRIHLFHGLRFVQISASHEMFRNPQFWNIYFFSILFPYYGNSLIHVFGTAWISASCETFQKPLIFECLFFQIIFPYCGNLLFPCFGNFMDSQEKSLQIHEQERYEYSHIFSIN